MSGLIFIISFFLLTLGLICSSSSSLKWRENARSLESHLKGPELSQSQELSEPTNQSLLPAHTLQVRDTAGDGLKTDPDETTETKEAEGTNQKAWEDRVSSDRANHSQKARNHIFRYYIKTIEGAGDV